MLRPGGWGGSGGGGVAGWQDHPQGLFSRITFSQPVYLGGAGNIRNVRSFLGIDAGVSGIILNIAAFLEIKSVIPLLKESVLSCDMSCPIPPCPPMS